MKLYRPKHLLTLQPGENQFQTIRDGFILVQKNIVLAAGAIEHLPKEASSLETQELDGLVTPGLVDCHTHLVFGGNRFDDFEKRSAGISYEQIAKEGGGIQSTVRHTKECSLEELIQAGDKHFAAMQRTGTVFAETKSGYGLEYETELRSLQASQHPDRSVTLLAHGVPPERREDRAAYVSEICQKWIPEFAKAGLISAVDVFVESIAFSHDEARLIAKAAKANNLMLHMHVDQLADSGGAQLAEELGATTADHLEHTDVSQLSSVNFVPVLLPGSVLGLGRTKYADARAWIEKSGRVALATDFNPGSSPHTSLPFMMNLACTHMKMTCEEAFLGCTIHAATALGIQNQYGTIEAGKTAKFAFWPGVSDWREIVVYGSWIQSAPIA